MCINFCVCLGNVLDGGHHQLLLLSIAMCSHTTLHQWMPCARNSSGLELIVSFFVAINPLPFLPPSLPPPSVECSGIRISKCLANRVPRSYYLLIAERSRFTLWSAASSDMILVKGLLGVTWFGIKQPKLPLGLWDVKGTWEVPLTSHEIISRLYIITLNCPDTADLP